MISNTDLDIITSYAQSIRERGFAHPASIILSITDPVSDICGALYCTTRPLLSCFLDESDIRTGALLCENKQARRHFLDVLKEQ